MSDEERSRLELAKARATLVLDAVPTSIESPLTVLASPAWRGVEADVWLAGANGRSTILKHYHADTEFYVDCRAAIEAACEAGKLGVGPKGHQQLGGRRSAGSGRTGNTLGGGWPAPCHRRGHPIKRHREEEGRFSGERRCPDRPASSMRSSSCARSPSRNPSLRITTFVRSWILRGKPNRSCVPAAGIRSPATAMAIRPI